MSFRRHDSPAALAQFEAFMTACTESPLMSEQFKSHPQRTVACECQFDRARNEGTLTPQWAEIEASIVKDGIIFTANEARIVFSGLPAEEIEGGKPSPFDWKPNAVRLSDSWPSS